jgi:hypothetical protein
MTLVEFLLARIAEDETGARVWARIAKHALPDEAEFYEGAPTPTRVLAECEAKRNLVRYSTFMLQAWDDKHAGRESSYPDMTRRERHTAKVILEQLADVYADHPDYREEW